MVGGSPDCARRDAGGAVAGRYAIAAPDRARYRRDRCLDQGGVDGDWRRAV